MDRLTANQRFLINKRKVYTGLPLLHIPKRRAKTQENTEYTFPEDLEESFLQGELGGIQRNENGVPRNKHTKSSSAHQRQFHYFTDRNTSLNRNCSLLGNIHVFEKAYNRRKTEKNTLTEFDQTVPDAEALYRDIESEVYEDYSPFLDELDVEEGTDIPEKKLGTNLDSFVQDNHVTKEMIEEFKYEYNGTQHDHADAVDITSNLQKNSGTTSRDANINHQNINANSILYKEKTVSETNNQRFSSMFTKSDDINDTCTKEKHKAYSLPWLNARKQYNEKYPNEDNASTVEPKQLWCYVNEDYLTAEQSQSPETYKDTHLNTEPDDPGLTKETDADIKAPRTVIDDAKPENSNIHVVSQTVEDRSVLTGSDKCEIKDNDEKPSEQQTIKELPGIFAQILKPNNGKATAKFHELSECCDFKDDSEDYIPSSQMPMTRKNFFIQTNPDPVDNNICRIDANTKEPNTCKDKASTVLFQCSEDSDTISDSQNIREPSKKNQVLIFQHTTYHAESERQSYVGTIKITGELSKKSFESAAFLNPADDYSAPQDFRELHLVLKGENPPNKVQTDTQGIKSGESSITHEHPSEVSNDGFIEDDIIPSSGHSDPTTVFQQIPESEKNYVLNTMNQTVNEKISTIIS